MMMMADDDLSLYNVNTETLRLDDDDDDDDGWWWSEVVQCE